MPKFKCDICGQSVLPDKSILIRQKLIKNAKIQKFKCDIISNFQPMWVRHSGWNNPINVERWDFFDGFQTNVDEAKTK